MKARHYFSISISLIFFLILPHQALLQTPDGDLAPLGNRDGNVDVGDAMVALRFALLLEIPTPEDIQHGDVAPLDTSGLPHPDGKIDVGDALVILRNALGFMTIIATGGGGGDGEGGDSVDSGELAKQYENLVGDTSSVGNPVEPIPFSKYNDDVPEDALEYNNKDYYVLTREMHGREVTVAFDKAIDHVEEDSAENFSQFIFNVWDYYWNIFEGFPFENYTVVFLTGQPRWGGAHGIGYEWQWSSSTASIKPYSHAHEVFHAWNAFGDSAISAKQVEDKWFVEGITVYYENRTAALLGNNRRIFENVQEDFSSDLRSWSLEPYLNTILNTELDMPLTEMSKWHGTPKGELKAHYRKGSLVGYLLDKKLHDDGTHLDSFLRYMYKTLDYGLTRYTSEMLPELLHEFTGRDYSQFFADYVFGTTPLPLDQDAQFHFFVNSTPERLFLSMKGDV
jgi:hypothetical protein